MVMLDCNKDENYHNGVNNNDNKNDDDDDDDDVDDCPTSDRRIRRTTKMMMMIKIATPKTGGSVAGKSGAIDIINSVEGERSEVNKKKLFIYL